MTHTTPSPGCYLDSHRGHYITRDAILLAADLGYKLADDDRALVDRYEAESHEADYPFEALVDLCDEAVEFLNRERGLAGHWWDFNDGDFGLYPIDEED